MTATVRNLENQIIGCIFLFFLSVYPRAVNATEAAVVGISVILLRIEVCLQGKSQQGLYGHSHFLIPSLPPTSTH